MVVNFASGLREGLLDFRTLVSITCWHRRPGRLSRSAAGASTALAKEVGVPTTQEVHL